MNYIATWRPLNKQESAINAHYSGGLSRAQLKEQFRAFLCALEFLSTIPIAKHAEPSTRLLGQAVAWYPVVGLLIGLLLGLVGWMSVALFTPWISAALVLTCWVLLTGALHLDGLADSSDAWMGGLGSRTRTLSIMKDPNSGPIAICTLILVLLLKLTSLHALVAAHQYWAFIWALVFARCYAVLLLMHTPYVREKGFGSAPKEHLSETACYLLISVVSLTALLALSWKALPVMLIGLASAYGLRQLMLKRLKGCTGDTIGALIELTEVVLLLAIAAVFS